MACGRSITMPLAWIVFQVTVSCGFDNPSDGSTSQRPPHLEALSLYSASLGTPIQGHGSGFPVRASAGRLQLVFRGNFVRIDGRTMPVNTAVNVRSQSGNTLVWDQLGPYGHPFTQRGEEPGTFRGTVGARLIKPDNQQFDDPSPGQFAFTVEPSLLVRRFTPLTAQCPNRVPRAFASLPYGMTVEAIGFVPRSITYVLSAPEIGFVEISSTHERLNSNNDDIFFLMPDIPLGMSTYALLMRVSATDTTGRLHQMAFAVGVHQPIEVVYDLQPKIAEIYAPQAVTACMHGGMTGRDVTYSETMTETLTRSATYNWDRRWIAARTLSQSTTMATTASFSFTTGRSVANSHTDSVTNGWSLSNGFNVTTTDGRSGSWTLSKSDQLSNSMDVNEGNSMSVANGFNFSPNGTMNPPSFFSPASYNSAAFPISLPNVKKLWVLGNAGAETIENSVSAMNGRSITEGASASASRQLFASRSIDESETSTDTNSVTNSASQTQSLGVTQSTSNGISQTEQMVNQTHGSNTEAVSSSKTINTTFGGMILAGYYGAFYRQTLRLLLQGSIVAYDQCGAGEIVGQVSGTTYTWAPDLAQGPTCRPLPQPDLPPYQCLIAPCTRTPE